MSAPVDVAHPSSASFHRDAAVCTSFLVPLGSRRVPGPVPLGCAP